MPTSHRHSGWSAACIGMAVLWVGCGTAWAHTPHTPAKTGSTPGAAKPATVCPLGTFLCPPQPVSFNACRANDLLRFYQPGLPTDPSGRASALTHVAAQQVSAANNTIYHLNGDVSLQRWDQLVRADHITYNDATTAYLAKGHVTYQDSGQLLSADRVQGTTQPEHVDASHVHYQLLASHGNGKAASALIKDPKHSRFSQATYSTCDPGHHVWEFRAKRITINKQTGVGVARDATLRLGSVPLFYWPWMSFPVNNQRKTGLLYPTFSHNSNSGFVLNVPYYLNLAPNYDATLVPQIYTKRGVMLGSQFRYLFGGTHGALNFNYLPDDRHAGSDSDGITRTISDGANRFLLGYTDLSHLSGNWYLHVGVNRASDRYYFQDFESALSGYTTPSQLDSSTSITGSGSWWSAYIGATAYQNVDPVYTDTSLPYARRPNVGFNIDLPVSRHWTLNMTNQAVAFRSDDRVQGNRQDFYPTLAGDYQGAAWFVRPSFAWRYTRYRLVDDPQRYGFTDTTPTRSLPIASVDSGLIFERHINLFGSGYTQTLEPRLYYLYVPYRNQSDIPIFDTGLMTFDYWQLFTPNRFSGADREMNANDLTAALTTRLLDSSGAQKASFSFGQIRYFTPQKVQLDPASGNTDFSGSDYVTQLSLALSQNWRLASAYQWDPNHNRTDVATFTVQRRIGADGIFNFAYRYRFQFMEQFDTSAVIPVSPSWRVLARWNVALRRAQTNWQRGQPKTLGALVGVEYDSCCIAVRLMARHYVRNVVGNTDNAIMFNIEFKGLGSTSPATETFLRHAILGYQ